MKKKNVLIFIRNRNTKAFLESFFRDSGKYHAIFCNSLPAFFSSLAHDSISAVLTEEPLAPHIRPIPAEIPLIIISEHTKEPGLTATRVHKADGFIFKPLHGRALSQTLQTSLRHSETVCTLKEEIRELKIINEFTQIISSTLDSKELLYLIVKKIAEIMPVTRCSIIRIDWIHNYAFVVATFETPDISMMKLNLKKYPEIVEALKKKKPILIKNISTDPIMKSVKDIVSPLGIRSILVMPIIFKQKVIGTLFLRTSRRRHSFTESEMRLLKTISDSSANTLYNAFLFSQIEDEKTRLEKMAITDYLTGIYNIRYFHHRMIEEFSRAERYGTPISCLMLDIDYFKKINDSYGHRIGDLVLKELASQLKKHTRKSDVLARYGGEEFIILLPQTSAEGAVMEAERIRNAIKLHAFKSMKSQERLTISIGISTFPSSKIKTHDELISRSDDALYEAKKRGRDRAVSYT